MNKPIFRLWLLLLLPVLVGTLHADQIFDPPVGEAVEWLLEHNREYSKAQADLEKARMDVRAAASDAYPSVEATASGTRLGNIQSFEFEGEDGTSVLKTAAEDNYSLSLGASQLLFSGSVFNAIGVARSYREVAENALRTERESLVRDFLTLYARITTLEELRQLNLEIVEQTKARYEDARLLQEIGSISRYDLLRSEVEYLNSVPELRESENLLDEALKALALQLDLEPGTRVQSHRFHLTNPVLAEAFPGLVSTPPDLGRVTPEQLTRFALQHRPETGIATHSVEGYRRAVNVYRSQSLPTLAAFANWERATSWDLFAQSDDWLNSWNAGLQLKLPLFTGFRTSSQVRKGKQDLVKAQADESQLMDAIRLEVETALNELERRALDHTAWQRNVEAAEEGLLIAETRRSAGAGSELELRDARMAMKAARVNRADADYNLLKARINLYHALGMMDQTEYIDD